MHIDRKSLIPDFHCAMEVLFTLDPTVLLLFLATFFGGFWFFNRDNIQINGSLRLPPGPRSWPLIGSLPSLTGDFRDRITEMKQRYGDVFTVQMGLLTVIILASYEATKEAYVKQGEAFSGRHQEDFHVKDIARGKGIILIEGKFWQDQRRTVHNILRKLGLGQNIMEKKIKEELEAFKKVLAENLNKPFDASWLIYKAVGNIMYSVVFGQRAGYDEPKFNRYLRNLEKGTRAAEATRPVTLFPFLQHMPGDLFKCKAALKIAEAQRSLLTDLIREHDTKSASAEEDFIDLYQAVMKENPELNIDDDQVVSVVGELFFAATETTSMTVRWAILYMLHNPDSVTKIQKEIDEVIGQDRYPCMTDQPKLPYTEAFINEVHRLSSVNPLGVPHSTKKDTHFRGYLIPKGTMVMSSQSTCHLDPDVWSEPKRFKPERFLDESGTKVVNTEKVIPFSIGKRLCLGKDLAQSELFLFTTYLLQKFTFEPVDGQPLPTLRGILSISHIPKKYEFVVKARCATNI